MRLPPLRPLLITGLLVFVLVCTFLPARYQGFARPPGRLATTITQPVSHLFAIFASSVRDGSRRPVYIESQYQLNEELQLRYAAIRRLEVENARLRRDLAELQQLSRAFDTRSYRFLQADVTARTAEPTAATLTINRGSADDIAVGQAVVSGANLLGQVVEAGSRVSQVRLLTAPGSRVQAIVMPAVWAGPTPPSARQLCQFEVIGPRRLEAIVPEDYAVAVGDVARLRDADWPPAAQGMVVGEVVLVEPIAEPVLRKRVVIETLITVRYLRGATVIVPRFSRGLGR